MTSLLFLKDTRFWSCFRDWMLEGKQKVIKIVFLEQFLCASLVRQLAPKPPSSTPTTACAQPPPSPWRASSATPGRWQLRPPQCWRKYMDPNALKTGRGDEFSVPCPGRRESSPWIRFWRSKMGPFRSCWQAHFAVPMRQANGAKFCANEPV